MSVVQKAAAENLYTYGIEEILEALQDELRVVHTVHAVHPREVDQHLPNWVQAIKAEMNALEVIGQEGEEIMFIYVKFEHQQRSKQPSSYQQPSKQPSSYQQSNS